MKLKPLAWLTRVFSSENKGSSATLRFQDSWYSPNWFQLGKNKTSSRMAMASSAVYSCVSVLAQETARLDIYNYELQSDRSRVLITNSAAASVLRKPNNYQSKSDWMLYLMMSLLLDGNAYCYAERDRRGAISAFHPIDPSLIVVHRVDETGEIFYQIGADATQSATIGLNDLRDKTFIPARDMLHVRLFCLNDPMIGYSPLQALGPAISLGGNIQQQSAAFFANMARPAGILRTPKPLAKEAAERIQQQWSKMMSGENVGRTAVLDNDVDWRPLTMSAVDAEVIAQYKMSVETVAQVYRIPMFMLGDLEKTSFNNVESMQKAFVMSALGFYLKHIENALDDIFGMNVSSYLEFDLERGLLRPDLLARVTAYTKGIVGGMFTPNEPRARENLPPVAGGDQIYMQKQNWPIDMLGSDAAMPDTGSESDPEEEDEIDDEATEDDIKAWLRSAA